MVTGKSVCNVHFSQSLGSHSDGKKIYPLQLGQIIYVPIVALVHRNSQEFGTLNTFHEEIIVPKDLFEKIPSLEFSI